MTDSLEFTFPEANVADAGRLVDDLEQHLHELDITGKTSVSRASVDAMDLGTVLIAVLGTCSVTALARGLAAWISKNGDPAIRIKRGKDEIIIQSGLSADQKFELAKKALEMSK